MDGNPGQGGITLESLLEAPLFSEELDIALSRSSESEVFKWFLASLLYGARMLGAIAARTYRAFERHGLLTPEAILDAGRDVLVHGVMREEASALGISLDRFDRKSFTFARLESGLLHVRLGRARKRPPPGPGPVLWLPEPSAPSSAHSIPHIPLTGGQAEVKLS